MLKNKKLLYILPEMAFTATVGETPKTDYYFVETFHQINGEFMKDENFVHESLKMLFERVEEGVYTAPNGRSFESGSTPAVAQALINVQPDMARLKEVIAYAPEDLVRSKPECALFDFIVDRLAADVAKVTGRRVDFGFTNTGGIRVDIPAGDVLLDDLVSMLPFKNYLTWVELKGSDLRTVLEYMAETKPQCISGGRVVIKGGKLVSAEIGGEPLDDERVYGVATIDFLLDGGDGFKLARGARDYVITDVLIGDAILADVRALTAAGKPLEYKTDGRITVEE